MGQEQVEPLANPRGGHLVTLVGFKARNHPQQTVKDAVDDRGTTADFFAQMTERFGPFDLDVAAASHNAKCERYYTIEDDGLTQPWNAERVWCNPPYSNIGAWVERAWWLFCAGQARNIVMLLPANRTEQKWWQEHIEPRRDRPNSPLRVEFLPGRMRFDRPGVVIGPKGDRPPFGCCLLIWETTT
jgi:phage N-6-adenine-methyltransferase